MSGGPAGRNLAIPGCKLDAPGLGAQLTRYRQLAAHGTRVERHTGQVLARFGDNVPLGLLERTLDVERHCCPFVHTEYDERERQLRITVETIDQDPRLDSLFYALTNQT